MSMKGAHDKLVQFGAVQLIASDSYIAAYAGAFGVVC